MRDLTETMKVLSGIVLPSNIIGIRNNCMPDHDNFDLGKYLPTALDFCREILKSKLDEMEQQREMLSILLNQRGYEQRLDINAQERMRLMDAICLCIERADESEERMALLKLWQDMLTMPIIKDVI